MKDVRLQYSVPPEYRHMIVEIYLGDDHFGELNTESGQLSLVIFNRANGNERNLEPAALIAALTEAERELRRRSRFFGE